MTEGTQNFIIRRDLDTSVWVFQLAGGRVFVRSSYKDTALDLGRHIARSHAPSTVTIHHENGRKPKVLRYRTPQDD